MLHCTYVKSVHKGYDMMIFDNAVLDSSKCRWGDPQKAFYTK